jgi:hypothetical protein
MKGHKFQTSICLCWEYYNRWGPHLGHSSVYLFTYSLTRRLSNITPHFPLIPFPKETPILSTRAEPVRQLQCSRGLQKLVGFLC